MNYISKNNYLSEAEMKINARCIWDYLGTRGWSLNAVAAMLGNMETESTINPGIWESLEISMFNGFGLVQWTPATKYLDWAESYDLDPNDIVSQLKRIEYEVEAGIQWIPTSMYPLSFAQFKVSEFGAGYLAMAFLYNYERPASLDQPNRATQAVKWYEYLRQFEPIGPNDPNSPTYQGRKGMKKLLMYAATRRYVVR